MACSFSLAFRVIYSPNCYIMYRNLFVRIVSFLCMDYSSIIHGRSVIHSPSHWVEWRGLLHKQSGWYILLKPANHDHCIFSLNFRGEKSNHKARKNWCARGSHVRFQNGIPSWEGIGAHKTEFITHRTDTFCVQTLCQSFVLYEVALYPMTDCYPV